MIKGRIFDGAILDRLNLPSIANIQTVFQKNKYFCNFYALGVYFKTPNHQLPLQHSQVLP